MRCLDTQEQEFNRLLSVTCCGKLLWYENPVYSVQTFGQVWHLSAHNVPLSKPQKAMMTVPETCNGGGGSLAPMLLFAWPDCPPPGCPTWGCPASEGCQVSQSPQLPSLLCLI